MVNPPQFQPPKNRQLTPPADTTACGTAPTNGLLVPSRRQNRRLVHQVLQVGTAEAGRALGDVDQGDALGQLLVPQ